MKAILSGLALSTAIFAAHAEPPIVDKEVQTVSWFKNRNSTGSANNLTQLFVLNCQLGTFSHIIGQGNQAGGMSPVSVAITDLLGAKAEIRADSARNTCKENGLTPGF